MSELAQGWALVVHHHVTPAGQLIGTRAVMWEKRVLSICGSTKHLLRSWQLKYWCGSHLNVSSCCSGGEHQREPAVLPCIGKLPQFWNKCILYGNCNDTCTCNKSISIAILLFFHMLLFFFLFPYRTSYPEKVTVTLVGTNYNSFRSAYNSYLLLIGSKLFGDGHCFPAFDMCLKAHQVQIVFTSMV